MKRILIILISLFFITFSCIDKEGHKFITIINNSNEDVICLPIIQGKISPDDTLYRCRMTKHYFNNNKCILESSARKDTWEDNFNKIPLPYIQLLIVKDSVASHIPCDTIRKYNMVLHRYQLTLEDLQSMNWEVYYPPE